MDGPAATTQDHESHAGALIALGLEGASFETVLGRYCDALVALGVPLLRVHVAMTAKHPEFGGDAHHWWRGKGARRERFARSEGGPSADWLASPLVTINIVFSGYLPVRSARSSICAPP